VKFITLYFKWAISEGRKIIDLLSALPVAVNTSGAAAAATARAKDNNYYRCSLQASSQTINDQRFKGLNNRPTLQLPLLNLYIHRVHDVSRLGYTDFTSYLHHINFHALKYKAYLFFLSISSPFPFYFLLFTFYFLLFTFMYSKRLIGMLATRFTFFILIYNINQDFETFLYPCNIKYPVK
jgi:hypothetical protein